MGEFEGRSATRIKSENFVSYRLYDHNNLELSQGVVKTLDVSRMGIALEFPVEVQLGFKVELVLGVGNGIVKTTGIIENCKPSSLNHFHVGVRFDFLTEDDLNKIGLVYPSILK